MGVDYTQKGKKREIKLNKEEECRCEYDPATLQSLDF